MFGGYGVSKGSSKVRAGVALWVAIGAPAALGQVAIPRHAAKARATENRAPLQPPLARPKLVVMLVVDQMRVEARTKAAGRGRRVVPRRRVSLCRD
jgi:hypothetical protein